MQEVDQEDIAGVQDLTAEAEKRLMRARNRLELIRHQEDVTMLRRYQAVLAGLNSDVSGLPQRQRTAAQSAIRIYVSSGRRILEQMENATHEFLQARNRQNDAQMRFAESSQRLLAGSEHKEKRRGFFSRLLPVRRKQFTVAALELVESRESVQSAVVHIREDIDTQTDALDAYTRLRAEFERNLMEMVDMVNGYRLVGDGLTHAVSAPVLASDDARNVDHARRTRQVRKPKAQET